MVEDRAGMIWTRGYGRWRSLGVHFLALLEHTHEHEHRAHSLSFPKSIHMHILLLRANSSDVLIYSYTVFLFLSFEKEKGIFKFSRHLAFHHRFHRTLTSYP